MKHTQKKIDNAKAILRESGYYVENLWHVDDVKGKYECDDDEAYEILDNAIFNEVTFERIWLAIYREIDSVKN
jgi:hypothetical protein